MPINIPSISNLATNSVRVKLLEIKMLKKTFITGSTLLIISLVIALGVHTFHRDALADTSYSVKIWVSVDEGPAILLEDATVVFRFWDSTNEQWSDDKLTSEVSPGTYKFTYPELTSWQAEITAPELDEFVDPDTNPAYRSLADGPSFEWWTININD